MYIHTYLCVSVEDHQPGTESPALFSAPGKPKSCPEEMAMATCLGRNSSWDDKNPRSSGICRLTGWWYTYPSEKYELVNWDDKIPNIWEK